MARPARRLSRLRLGVVGMGIVLSLPLLLSGCGGSQAAALAHEACTRVAKARALELRASREGGERSSALRRDALRELQLAGPDAMLASSGDDTWDALSANLGRSAPRHSHNAGPQGRLRRTGVKGA